MNTTELREFFAERLRIKRAEVRQSQADFAAGLKISPMSLSRYERNTRWVSIDTIQEVLNQLGLDLDIQIISLTGISKPPRVEIRPVGAQLPPVEETDEEFLRRTQNDIAPGQTVGQLPDYILRRPKENP